MRPARCMRRRSFFCGFRDRIGARIGLERGVAASASRLRMRVRVVSAMRRRDGTELRRGFSQRQSSRRNRHAVRVVIVDRHRNRSRIGSFIFGGVYGAGSPTQSPSIILRNVGDPKLVTAPLERLATRRDVIGSTAVSMKCHAEQVVGT